MSNMLRHRQAYKWRQLLSLEKRNLARALRLLGSNWLMVIISSLVVAIALAFPASLLISARNLKQLAGNWEKDLHIEVYLERGITASKRQALLDTIESFDNIQSYSLITANQALAEFSQQTGLGALIDALDYNPLPDLISLEPTSQHPDVLESLLHRLADMDGVASVNFDQKWANTLNKFFGLLDFFTSLVLQLLLIGLFALITGNVNALVARSANEIRVIKLIGGSDSFVSRPYIYFGALTGLLGGLCAFGVVVFVLVRLGDSVTGLLQSYSLSFQLQQPTWYELLFLVLIPALLGMGAAIFSCRSAMSKALPDFA